MMNNDYDYLEVAVKQMTKSTHYKQLPHILSPVESEISQYRHDIWS